MTTLMTKRKADALKSIERDRHLLSDAAARDRYEEATPDERRMSQEEIDRWNRIRDRTG